MDSPNIKGAEDFPEVMTVPQAVDYVMHLLGESVSTVTMRSWCVKYGIGNQSPPVAYGTWRVFKKKLYNLMSPAIEAIEKNKSQSMEEIEEELNNSFNDKEGSE